MSRPRSKSPAVRARRDAPVRARAVAEKHTVEFEFMGPYIGPLGILVGLPTLTWFSAFYLNGAGWSVVPTALPTLDDVRNSFSLPALGVVLAYFFFQAILYKVVPGRVVSGTLLRDGKTKLSYPLNGFACLLITAAAAAAVHKYVAPLTWICDNFLQLSVASTLLSFALSVALYAASFRSGAPMLAEGGSTHVGVYDFFIGRELNPRLFGIDLKYFCELRPGLFGWLIINAAFALREVAARGATSPSMGVVLLLQGLYVLDALWSESAILTTMDITTDGFGFMLVFGDLAWVPFMYSLQARFLAEQAREAVPHALVLFSLALGLAGYYVFRAANGEKDLFKRDPRDPAVRNLPTVRGRLLAGGWWGVARHVNYFADLVLALGFSLATGFSSPFTYFYPAYFAVLLWHRERRDDHKCALKYGDAWDEYRERVPSRIIPFIY